MKNSYKSILVTGMLLIAFSCQENDEVPKSNEAVSKHNEKALESAEEEVSKDLAIFQFNNGNMLTLSETEGEDASVTAWELGSLKAKVMIDFKKHSMLDVYMMLTPTGTPVPKALVEDAQKEGKPVALGRRNVVETLEHTLTFKLDEIPTSLIQENNTQQGEQARTMNGFCEEHTVSKHGECTIGPIRGDLALGTWPDRWRCIVSYAELWGVWECKPGCPEEPIYVHHTVSYNNKVEGVVIQKKRKVYKGQWSKLTKRGFRRLERSTRLDITPDYLYVIDGGINFDVWD